MTFFGLSAAVVACLSARSEDVVQACHGWLHLIVVDVVFVVLADEVKYGERAVKGESVDCVSRIS